MIRISYDVVLTVANSYGTDTKFTRFITYSNDPIIMGGFDCDGCQENFSSVTLQAEDSYGDEWKCTNVLIDGEPFTQYTLSSGYSEEINLCIPSLVTVLK